MSLYALAPLAGTIDVFELLREQRCVGIVWRSASTWHADRYSMADPEITSLSREDAVQRLTVSLEALGVVKQR